ncbi:hypothetical protein HYV81_04530 [Candidatus Woesearchaeota archaeon]|nr:hypothetical protein [Candidatus Woesearchaeota archaeon]
MDTGKQKGHKMKHRNFVPSLKPGGLKHEKRLEPMARDKQFDWENWRNVLLIGLAAILIVNVIILFILQGQIKNTVAQAEEQSKPAQLQFVTIKDSSCTNCVALERLVELLKEGKVTVTKETVYERNDAQARELIAQYSIERIPALIVTGEVEKSGLAQQLEKRDDAYVLATPAPYIDLKTGSLKGVVSAVLIFKDGCRNCTDLNEFLVQAKAAGVYINDEKKYEASSKEGQQLLSKYSIKKLPALVFSDSIGDYEAVQQNWAAVGTHEADGSYILREVAMPYYDLQKKDIVGLVDITYITDKSCTACYDAALHKQILASLGVTTGDEHTYDISSNEGKRFLQNYNITKVPTIFLSNDLEAYPQVVELWKEVGTATNDTATGEAVYVFRFTEALGTYKDLKSNKVVEPQPQAQ